MKLPPVVPGGGLLSGFEAANTLEIPTKPWLQKAFLPLFESGTRTCGKVSGGRAVDLPGRAA
jgi:hypothetical protein